MTVRSTILANLSEPNRAYVVLLGGMLLIFREFVRPGRVLPGVFGAVFAGSAIYGLAQSPWTWHGIVLVASALVLLAGQIRRESNLLAAVAAVAFAAGSWLVVPPPRRISMITAALGVPFLLLTAYLVRAAVRARRAKLSAD